MADEEKAVKEEVEDSASETTEEEVSNETDASTSEESKTVPYERFKEVNDQLKELKAKESEQKAQDTKTEEKPARNKGDEPFDIEQKVELRMSGLSAEEISHLTNYIKGSGKNPSDVVELKDGKAQIKDPFVKSAFDGMREAKRSETATPPPSKAEPTKVDGKTITEMNPREKREHYKDWLNKEVAKSQGGKNI